MIPLTSDNENNLDPQDRIVVVNGPTGKPVTIQDGTLDSSGDHQTNSSAYSTPAVIEIHNEITGVTIHPTNAMRSVSDPPSPITVNGNNDEMDSGDKNQKLQRSTSESKPLSSTSHSDSPSSISLSNSMDFFSKYDKNIAFLKGEVAKLENNAT